MEIYAGEQFTFATSTIAGGVCTWSRTLSQTTVVANQWYHVSGTYDKATGARRLYVNGNLETSTTVGNQLRTDANARLQVSRNNSASPYLGIHGDIDDLRFYDRALTASEVASLAAARPGSSNGACGTANNVAVTTAPTTNLCATGTATPVTGTGPWSWTCNGSGGGASASCSAPLMTGPSAISIATTALRPERTTTITPTPATASLANCTSSATAVATIAAGTITAVARGDAIISCGTATAEIAVRNPRVYSVEPGGGVARVGLATIFTVTGRDLDGPIRFSIEGCDGNDVELVTPQRPPFVVQSASAVRRFMCVPTGSPGARRVFVRSWGNPAPDWARGFVNFGTEAPGCDQTLFPGCTVNVSAELSGAEASPSARLALLDALRAQYANAESGEVPWDTLTKATVDAIYAALASGGVKTSLTPELEQIRKVTLNAIDARTTSQISSVGGTIRPYTWKDMAPGSGFWTDWTAYVLADGMTGKDWLKFVGSVSANAALAVGDVLAISSAATAAKIARQSGKAATGLKRWLQFQNATPKLTRVGRVLEQISTLAETGEGALSYGQLTDAEQADWKEVVALFKPLAGDALSNYGPIETWLKQGGPAAGLNAPLRKALMSISVDMLFALPGILADEGISQAALTELRNSLGEAVIDATPVIGRWKATYEVADKFWGRKADKVFGDVHDLIDESRQQGLQVLSDLRLLNLRLLFDRVDAQTGQAALLRSKFLASQTLPTSGFSQAPSAIKRVVVLTHGWNSSTEAWPRPLLNAFCARRGLSVTQVTSDLNLPVVNAYCEGGRWLLMAFNWRPYARIVGGAGEIIRPPQSALANAMNYGQQIAKDLIDVGIRPELLHAIGHSAGAGLVDTITIEMKARVPTLISHNTYLDAYCPNPNNCAYGESASWAEQYVDSRFSTDLAVGSHGVVGALVSPKMTNVDLPAYNFDVTTLDGRTFLNVLGTDDHAWPYRLYGRSANAVIDNAPSSSLTAVGPTLSAVWAGQANAVAWLNSLPSLLTASKVRCKLNRDSPLGRIEHAVE